MQTSAIDTTLYISVAKDFSRTPGPRLKKHGSFSGEAFRDEILIPKFREALKHDQKLVVDLDSTAGYLSSFLEEAFGGLVRAGNEPARVKQYLEIKSDDEPYWIQDIEDDYIPNAIDTNH
jgi:STAS-like domain of unknown function (DUF4325)